MLRTDIGWSTRFRATLQSSTWGRKALRHFNSNPFPRVSIAGYEISKLPLETISSAIAHGAPALVARLGTTEMRVLDWALSFRGRSPYPSGLASDISSLSGVFSNDRRSLDRFVRDFAACIETVDVLGVREDVSEKVFWPSETNAIEGFFKGKGLISIETLSSFPPEACWTQLLEGKKVLVVHPFAALIKRQYGNRSASRSLSQLLPSFELSVIRSHQFLAESTEKTIFPSWFDGLEDLKAQMDDIDYDIALVGAGAMGIFLAAHAKKRGRVGIHVGGVLQIYFGILGKRWEVDQRVMDLLDSYWVRPGSDLSPQGFRTVEDGCYW